MGKEYKSRKKRRGRRDLINEIRNKDEQILIEHGLREAAEEETHRIQDRIREIGFKCVDTYAGAGDIARRIDVERIDIKPDPMGMYMVLRDEDVENIDIKELVEHHKSLLIHKMAEAMIENNLVQFIVHSAKEPTPFGPRGMSTVGVKMYVIPWEKVSYWKDHITMLNIRKYRGER